MSQDFDLETFLPYLLNQAAEATSQGFAQHYRTQHGMTRTQWRVLANLGRFGTMTARDICRISHIEKTKVSRSVAALEAKGWLARQTAHDDRRAEILSLTPNGLQIFKHLGEQASAYDASLRRDLGPEAAAMLVDLLRRLAANQRGEDDQT